mgnify:CR=1 FL=1
MFLGAFGFLYMGIVGGCSQPVPDLCYQIEVDKPLQTMDYFGASDAWSMQFIGLWPQEKQNQIADWLFSMENDENGKPKGIGLSLWRFNVGAGSTEQVPENVHTSRNSPVSSLPSLHDRY